MTLDPGFRALVADDDPVIRCIVKSQLLALGAEDVALASSGRAALAQLEESAGFDLLVTDLRMPEMDGVELLRELGQREQAPAVLLISGLGDKLLEAAREVASAYTLNILGAVSKPVTRAQLQDILQARQSPESRPAAPQGDGGPDRERLRESVQAGRLVIVVQPLVPLDPSANLAVEVLVRWTDPDLAAFGTETLIRAAEADGLIDAVTGEVLAQTFSAWQAWQAQGLRPRISFNISALSLQDVHFPEALERALPGLGPGDIVVEMTETALTERWSESLDVVLRLRLKGYGLAIDDYGTGYASLSELRKMPFDELKIDASFVAQLGRSAEARAIVESSLRLAQKLGLRTVAEGVETEAQFRLLAELGADYIQGYFLGRPMPPKELPDWWRRFSMPPH